VDRYGSAAEPYRHFCVSALLFKPIGAGHHDSKRNVEPGSSDTAEAMDYDEMKRTNRVVAVVFALLSIGVLYVTTTFRATLIIDAYLGAGFFPRAIAVLMLVFAVVLWFMEPRVRPETLTANDSESDGEKYSLLTDMRAPLITTILLIVYASALPYLGFPFATSLSFIALLALLQSRVWWHYLFAIAFSVVLFYVFYDLFRVRLPRGVLF